MNSFRLRKRPNSENGSSKVCRFRCYCIFYNTLPKQIERVEAITQSGQANWDRAKQMRQQRNEKIKDGNPLLLIIYKNNNNNLYITSAEERTREWQEKIAQLNKTIKRNEAKHRKEMRARKLEIQELKFGKMQQPRKPRKKASSHETGEHSDKDKDKEKEKKEKEGVKMTPDERKSLILSEIISTEVTYIEMLTMAIEVSHPPPS